MSQKKPRKKNFTQTENGILVREFNKHRQELTGKHSSKLNEKIKSGIWNEIQAIVNRENPQVERTIPELKRKLSGIEQNARAKYDHPKKTGGGPPLSPYTPAEAQVIEAMKGRPIMKGIEGHNKTKTTVLPDGFESGNTTETSSGTIHERDTTTKLSSGRPRQYTSESDSDSLPSQPSKKRHTKRKKSEGRRVPQAHHSASPAGPRSPSPPPRQLPLPPIPLVQTQFSEKDARNVWVMYLQQATKTLQAKEELLRLQIASIRENNEE